MKRFKEFFTEEEQHHNVVLDVNDGTGKPHGIWHKNIEQINHELLAILADPFVNSLIFINAVRGTVERFGIVVPANQTMQQLSQSATMCYHLGESGYMLHVQHHADLNGYIKGTACICTHEEMESKVAGMASHVPVHNPLEDINRMRRQVRHSNDDSGNDGEY